MESECPKSSAATSCSMYNQNNSFIMNRAQMRKMFSNICTHSVVLPYMEIGWQTLQEIGRLENELAQKKRTIVFRICDSSAAHAQYPIWSMRYFAQSFFKVSTPVNTRRHNVVTTSLQRHDVVTLCVYWVLHVCEQQRLWRDCTYAQVCLSLLAAYVISSLFSCAGSNWVL